MKELCLNYRTILAIGHWKPDSRPRPKTVHKMEVASRLSFCGYVSRDSPGPTTAQTMNRGRIVAEKAKNRAKTKFFSKINSLQPGTGPRKQLHLWSSFCCKNSLFHLSGRIPIFNCNTWSAYLTLFTFWFIVVSPQLTSNEMQLSRLGLARHFRASLLNENDGDCIMFYFAWLIDHHGICFLDCFLNFWR